MPFSKREWALLLGALTMTAIAYLSSKVTIISSDYTLYSGLVGGFLVSFVLNRSWDENVGATMYAAVLALTLTIIVFMTYDVVLTSRYDVQITEVEYPPQELLSKIMIYSIYELTAGIYLFVIFLMGGLMGSIIGSVVNTYARAYVASLLPRSTAD